jgi:hypothetical protein
MTLRHLRIEESREHHQLGLKKFAEPVGIRIHRVCNWERWKRRPKGATQERVGEALSLSMDFLHGDNLYYSGEYREHMYNCSNDGEAFSSVIFDGRL